jgi:cation-transporting ATPase I
MSPGTAVTAQAERYGLSTSSQDEATAHPGGLREVRTHAAALATAAITTPLRRLRRPPQVVAAALTLLREDPRAREFLRARLGRSTAELVITAAHAALHGFGQSPTDLALEVLLRTGQLADAVAQAVAFERSYEQLCAPGRDSPAAVLARRPAPSDPVTDYATTATTGGLVGAAATLLFDRNLGQAGSAVLAGSPKPAVVAVADRGDVLP